MQTSWSYFVLTLNETGTLRLCVYVRGCWLHGSVAPNPNIGGSSGAIMSGLTPPSRDTSPLQLHRRTNAARAGQGCNYQQLNTQRQSHAVYYKVQYFV